MRRPEPAGTGTRWRLVAALVALGLVAGGRVVAAQHTFAAGQVLQGTLSFDASATLGDFTGTTTTMTGQMTGGDLAQVQGWVEAPVATLKTGNGRRDRDLNKSMETEQYPTMRFDLAGATLEGMRGDTLAVTLSGRLSIHGVTRDVALPAILLPALGSLHLHSDFPLDVKDYEVGGLSKMLGMLRMNSHIVVHVDLTFAQ